MDNHHERTGNLNAEITMSGRYRCHETDVRSMIRSKFIFLVIVTLLVSIPSATRADCWAVYSEKYRNVYYRASGISLPHRAGNFATMGQCQSALNSMRSDPVYRYDTGLGETRCECSSPSYSAHSRGSFEQQLTTTIVTLFLNSLLNGFQTDPGPAGEAQRQALQKKWDKEEEERRVAEKKRLESVFVSAQAGALNLLGNRPGSGTSPSGPTSGNGVATGDGLKPGGNSFFGLGGGSGSGANTGPTNDPMVVDLRDLRRASYFVQTVETASTEDVPLLIDEALKAANGAPTSLGSIPPGAAIPDIDQRGLLAFQQVNIDYARAHDLQTKCTNDLKAAQQRRESAHRSAETYRAELEKMMAGKTDAASLRKKQELLAEIDAALKAEDKAWLNTKTRLAAAQDQVYKMKEESVRVLRALATGKEPAKFHPPIASLPALKEETWLEMQKRMMEERGKLDKQTNKLQKELASFVPPLKKTERVHEGVILGTFATDEKAKKMEEDGVSCFNGKTYAAMNQAAEQARKEGKNVVGAMVVSFGTPEQNKNPFDPFKYEKKEAGRVGGDHWTAGEVSLATPQGQKTMERLAGKEFDRLVAHSNGASVAEALIRNNVIKVNELNVVGGDRSLLNGHAYQRLLDSGKVKRVVVWVNLNDPVPGLTSLDQAKLSERSMDAAIHLTKKITGDLAGGDVRVEYHYMWGTDYRNTGKALGYSFNAHPLESSYYPGIANELGVKYVLPERVLNEK